MRHAFLIIAHDRPEELRRLILALDDPDHDIYVHLDKKSKLDSHTFSGLTSHSTLTFIPRRKVVWGGSSQIAVELDLFAAAHQQGGYRYYHLLSGVDYPVKSNDYIHHYFEQHDGQNFIAIEENGPRFRLRFDQYHFLQNTLVGKRRNLWKYIDFASCYMQKAVGIRRFPQKKDIRKFINWVSVTDEVVDLIVIRKEAILKQYRFTYCCDEVFLLEQIQDTPLYQTVAPQGNLRYIEWVWMSKHDSSPRTLTMQDITTLEKPDILFARKFNLPESKDLYAALDKARGM